MGYACPVCDAEQADAEHLANHLAVTASLGREDHDAWLEEHAPDWAERGPAELGEIVSEYAPEIDTPEFEDRDHAHAHGHGNEHDPGRPDSLEDGLARQASQPGRGAMTSEAESVLREAQELTQQMQQSDADADADAADATGTRDTDGDGGSDESEGENEAENENA